jgi:phosphoribosylformylglycinamidine synthase
VVGTATEERQLVLEDTAVESGDQKFPVDMPMDVLLGKPPKVHKDVTSVERELPAMDLTGVPLEKAVIEVLAHPPWLPSAS